MRELLPALSMSDGLLALRPGPPRLGSQSRLQRTDGGLSGHPAPAVRYSTS